MEHSISLQDSGAKTCTWEDIEERSKALASHRGRFSWDEMVSLCRQLEALIETMPRTQKWKVEIRKRTLIMDRHVIAWILMGTPAVRALEDRVEDEDESSKEGAD